MLKQLIILSAVALIGCASQPEKNYYPADMTNFVANCRVAKTQIDFLNQKIAEYQEHFRNRTPTLEDQRYYGKLKNNIWSLRSTCSAKYL